MIFVFYCLWILAIGKVLLGPTLRLATKFLFLLLIVIGMWIIGGGISYQVQYSQYLAEKKSFETKKQTYLDSEKKLEGLLVSHPTSRDVLLRLAAISYQIGDHPSLLGYVHSLRQVDPNDEKVKTFLHSIQ